MHVQHLQLQSLISKFHSTDYICVFTRCELIGLYMYLFIFLVVLLILVQPIFLAIINLFLGGRGKGSFIPFICHFIALLLCQFHYSYRNNCENALILIGKKIQSQETEAVMKPKLTGSFLI